MPRFRIRALMLLVACVAIAVSLFGRPGTVDDDGIPRPEVDLAIGFTTWVAIAAGSAAVWLLCRWFSPSETGQDRSGAG